MTGMTPVPGAGLGTPDLAIRADFSDKVLRGNWFTDISQTINATRRMSIGSTDELFCQCHGGIHRGTGPGFHIGRFKRHREGPDAREEVDTDVKFEAC